MNKNKGQVLLVLDAKHKAFIRNMTCNNNIVNTFHLAFLKRELSASSISSNSSSSFLTSLTNFAKSLISSTLKKQPFFFASSTLDFHTEPLADKALSFPRIQRQCLQHYAKCQLLFDYYNKVLTKKKQRFVPCTSQSHLSSLFVINRIN